MSTVFDAVFFGKFAIKFDFDGFKALGFASGAGEFAVFDPVEPTVRLDVRSVGETRIFFCYLNLDCFDAERFAGGARNGVVFYPISPTNFLNVCAVENVIVIGKFAIKSKLNRLDAFRLAGSAANFSVLLIIGFPAGIFNVSAIFDPFEAVA